MQNRCVILLIIEEIAYWIEKYIWKVINISDFQNEYGQFILADGIWSGEIGGKRKITYRKWKYREMRKIADGRIFNEAPCGLCI